MKPFNLQKVIAATLSVIVSFFTCTTLFAALTAQEIDQRLEKYRGSRLVFVSWGGAFQAAQRKAFLEPFSKKYGIQIIEDEPSNVAKLAAMVKSDNVTWDVYDSTLEEALKLGKRGYLEPLDYQIIDAQNVDKKLVSPWSIGTSLYSTILAYRTDVFPAGKAPSRVADMWDVKKYPGRRALEDDPRDNIVFALEADGVPPNQIYPLNDEKIKRAFKKLDQIKPYISFWWSQGAQPAQLLANKEVVLSTSWNGRIYAIQQEGIPVGIVWNGAQMNADVLCVPKGSKNKELAMLFIAWETLPENNARLSQYIPYAPSNQKALPLVNPATRQDQPGAHIAEQVILDATWWEANVDKILDLWRKWKLS